MEYRSYQVYVVLTYAIFGALSLGILSSVISGEPNPDYTPVIGLGIFLFLAGAIGFYVRFWILRDQLDRHDGSIPLPGILGAFGDIEDDDEDPNLPVSAQKLVSELSPDSARPRVVRCPHCGTEEPGEGSEFCRACGLKLLGHGPP
ncbi:MAG: zinc ribbon domain-containing protein [Thermoplasmata archaeon]|nr:zinc ribbon domain-containing protein [Thermoplasmata archaeon]MCI4333399.1 zinc ribbon domain-containing protein [Thermoplasmata archaeon]